MKIIISGEAMEAIRRAAMLPLSTKDCTPMSRGQWRIPLGARALNRIKSVQLAGETISDTIVRVLSVQKNGLN